MEMDRRKKRLLILALAGLAIVWLLFWFYRQPTGTAKGGREARPIPVEVVAITRGPMEMRRTFSGALQARAEFLVAPKVGGRVERLTVKISDPVRRGQVVGELDNDEYVQAVAQAQAELAVAKANLAQARSALEVANRDFERIKTLRKRGVASEAQLDTARANQLAKQVELEVSQAQVLRADSALESARIRLGYTKISAGWSGGSEERVVAERYVDEGETVSANTPLLRIVELDPITGVIFVTERDYARMRPGQEVTLATDAFSDMEFPGRIERIAPVFKEATRQARVELAIDNSRLRLRPGMFIRATVILAQIPEAVIVPEQALTKRDDRTGV
ncbi:MAG: efflux RND transporter periplasmic adaptor subunit, partial [Deltaproteobacteria bacterium]|nr:efflux RND transporter periplasmic adaptor subunit [Deltaproteobacteria bacterium]